MRVRTRAPEEKKEFIHGPSLPQGAMSLACPVTPNNFTVVGRSQPLKLAFLYVGPVSDRGWTYMHNQARLHLQRQFGDSVDVSTYIENVHDAQCAGHLRRLCDEDYDLVFTTSLGHMQPTIDTAAHYAPCSRSASDGQHQTYFVHATGYKTTSTTSTMFAKVYQAKYLAGMIAGDALAAPVGSRMRLPPGAPCVAYVAPFPNPELQRHINAFALGCRARFANCSVKVAFTGQWENHDLERQAARFFWHQERCRIVTQGTDTVRRGARPALCRRAD